MPGQRLGRVEENVKFDDLAQVAKWVAGRLQQSGDES